MKTIICYICGKSFKIDPKQRNIIQTNLEIKSKYHVAPDYVKKNIKCGLCCPYCCNRLFDTVLKKLELDI